MTSSNKHYEPQFVHLWESDDRETSSSLKKMYSLMEKKDTSENIKTLMEQNKNLITEKEQFEKFLKYNKSYESLKSHGSFNSFGSFASLDMLEEEQQRDLYLEKIDVKEEKKEKKEKDEKKEEDDDEINANLHNLFYKKYLYS